MHRVFQFRKCCSGTLKIMEKFKSRHRINERERIKIAKNNRGKTKG